MLQTIFILFDITQIYQIKDGKISIDDIKAIAYDDDEKTIATLTELGQECASIADENRCELSAKIMQCMLDGASKRGIDPKKGIQNLNNNN